MGETNKDYLKEIYKDKANLSKEQQFSYVINSVALQALRLEVLIDMIYDKYDAINLDNVYKEADDRFNRLSNEVTNVEEGIITNG